MTSATHSTDVAIIGAGPVGLFAVFECGMLKMRCHVIDALDTTGGQCAALYPEKPIYDIPGYPRIDAADLIRKLEEQVAPFQPVYHLGQQVESLTPGDGERLDRGDDGGHAHRLPRRSSSPPASAPSAPTGRRSAASSSMRASSVFYLVKQREDFRGKRIVIAGGGDSAVDWTLLLAEHRGAALRHPPPAEVPRRAGKRGAAWTRWPRPARSRWWCPISWRALEGSDGQLAAVIVATLDGQERRLEADVLLPFFGLAMNLGPIAAVGPQPRPQPHHGRPGDLRHQPAPASSPSATSRPIRAS